MEEKRVFATGLAAGAITYVLLQNVAWQLAAIFLVGTIVYWIMSYGDPG